MIPGRDSKVKRVAGPITFLLLFIAVLSVGLMIGRYNPQSEQPASGNSHNGPPEIQPTPWEWLTHDAAGFFTLGIFVVGTAQIGLFAWQLWIINESLKDAKLTAAATVEIVKSRRAWLLILRINSPTFTNARDGVKTGLSGTSISIQWKNFGETPAFKPKIWMKAVPVDLASSIISIEQDSAPEIERSTPIAQSVDFGSVSYHLYGDDYARFRNNIIKLFVYTKAEYFDMYEPEKLRTTEAFLEVRYNGDRVDPNGNVIGINVSATPVGPKNTAT